MPVVFVSAGCPVVCSNPQRRTRQVLWVDAAGRAGISVSFVQPRFCLGTLGARASSRGAALGARAPSRGAALDACAPACGARRCPPPRQRGDDDSQPLLNPSGRSGSLPKRSGRNGEGVSFPPRHGTRAERGIRATHFHTHPHPTPAQPHDSRRHQPAPPQCCGFAAPFLPRREGRRLAREVNRLSSERWTTSLHGMYSSSAV